MKQFLEFINDLQANNNKIWFDAHKEEYKKLQAEYFQFVEKLIDGIAKFDSSVKGLQVKDCTYRIYRDLRFSKDKLPYKQHVGTFIAPHGKKSGYAGYYFHMEPNVKHFLVSGLYLPDSKIQKSVREEIMLNGKNFDIAIKKANGFEIDWTDSLKKIPAGYDNDNEFAEYYKLKNFTLYKEIDKEYILSSNLLDKLLNDFEKTYEFNAILNKAVDYAIDMF